MPYGRFAFPGHPCYKISEHLFTAALAAGRTPFQSIREISVQAHKFDVGETVYFTSGMIGRANGSGSYQVVRLLPPDGQEFQYRIKKDGDAYERVAKESQLEIGR